MGLRRRANLLVAALTALLAQPACAQYLMRTLERGPVGYLHGQVLTQEVGDLSGGDFSHPAAADWDGDGQLDLVVGSGYGDLLLFRRVGPMLFAPAQALLPASDLRLDATPQPRQVSPWLGNWDGDGKLDLLLGLGDQVFLYSVSGGAASGGKPLLGAAEGPELRGPLAPCALDVSGDGRADLVVADGAGRVWALVADKEGGCGPPQRLAAAGATIEVAPPARPWAGDWDGDGRRDLVIGTGEGKLMLCRGTDQGLAAPQLIGAPETRWLPGGLAMRAAAPWLCDWDGDGDPDLLLGCRRGLVVLVERTGPANLRVAGYLQQRQAPVDAGRCAVASCGDWDGDGDLDLVVGGEDGYVRLYERLAGEGIRLGAGQLIVSDGGPVRAEAREGDDYLRYAWPALADWDGDRDLDLLIGCGSGRILVWENFGGLRGLGPVQVSGRVLRVSGIATPAPWDYNLDGKMDLFVGARTPPDKLIKPGEVPVPEISPGCAYFENTKAGTAQWPLFAKGVPVSMCLASEGSGPQHKDADFLQPYATYPARWRNAARPTFLTLTAYGTFAFENIAAPGAYAHLHLQSGNGVPPPLLPELYSCVPVELRVGEVGLLAADAAYGFLCYYPRSLFSE